MSGAALLEVAGLVVCLLDMDRILEIDPKNVEAVDALVDAFATGEPTVILLGHSQGALLALIAATRHPERVAGVVALAPPLAFGPDAAWYLRRLPALARWRVVRLGARMLAPFVDMLRVLPPPAIVPLSIFVFGIGSLSKIALIWRITRPRLRASMRRMTSSPPIPNSRPMAANAGPRPNRSPR